MTKNQKQAVREILRKNKSAWSNSERQAIQEALRMMRKEAPSRAELVQLRYFLQLSIEETTRRLHIGGGGTAYHKMDQDALSTVAICLAEAGVKLSR